MSLNKSNKYQVAIIGGGPAGATAALYLAMNNFKVILFEKEKLPRYKTCGGGLVAKGLNLLPIDPLEVAEKSFKSSVVYDHKNGERYSVKRDRPLIYMTMRSDFDYHLLKSGVDHGLDLRQNTAVKEIRARNDGVELITETGSFTADYVVNASGATGINRPGAVYRVPALEIELYTDPVTLKEFEPEARFDFGLIEHGYGWVFPKKDHLSIGIGIFNGRSNGSNLNILLDNYISELGITNISRRERHGYFIPINPERKLYNEGRTLFVGDSAGFADPITAEGISWAILSGKLAAEAILSDFPDAAKVLMSYNAAVRTKILTELKYARIIFKLVYGSERLRAFLFRKYGQKLCEIMTDVIAGDESYRGALTSKSNYLKLIKYYFRNT